MRLALLASACTSPAPAPTAPAASPPTQPPQASAPSAPAASAPAASASAASASAPGPITLAAVGDIMLGTTFPRGSPLPPGDGAGLLAEVTPVLKKADLAFGNLEGPLVDGDPRQVCTEGAVAERNHGRPGTSCWSFRMPTRYARHLSEAGFGALSLANNHILDFGDEGLRSTQRALDALGIVHSGPSGTVARRTVRGVTIDLIAFAPYRGLNDMNDLDAARSLVARSAASAGVVVVSFHGGAEGPDRQHVPEGSETFYGENRGAVRAFARAMVEAGADLVLGHGPHVVRGLEVDHGRLIAYSLGNFATYGAMRLGGSLGVSLILEARLSADGALLGGRVHPILQRPPGGPHLDPDARVIPMLQALSEQDFGEARAKIANDGEIRP